MESPRAIPREMPTERVDLDILEPDWPLAS